jgi:hypothetical protein
VTHHEPGCPLRGATWLGPGNDTVMDGAATSALHDALADFSDLDIWNDAGLAAALRRAAPAEDERRLAWCTCRRRTD